MTGYNIDMLPGDRLICAFVEPHAVGDLFKEWPLHITIVPWFRADIVAADIVASLASRLQQVKPFQVVLDGEDRFGRDRKVVHLVQNAELLTMIEHTARAYLKSQSAWLVDETTLVRRGFRPHVTNQAHAAAMDGQSFICDALYVIEQRGSKKAVVGKVELGV